MIGEFEIIARYFTRATADRDVVLGVGDDAAVLAMDGHLAVTVDTIEQAIERAGTKAGNKGVDAALAAIQMATVLRQLEQ